MPWLCRPPIRSAKPTSGSEDAKPLPSMEGTLSGRPRSLKRAEPGSEEEIPFVAATVEEPQKERTPTWTGPGICGAFRFFGS